MEHHGRLKCVTCSVLLTCLPLAWLTSVQAGGVHDTPYSGEQKNVARGKKVTSLVPESGTYARPAANLTDGNLETDAYPGAFSLAYAVALSPPSESGSQSGAPGFDIDSIVIHWGKFGRHFPGVKREDGSWAPASYKADYVNKYQVFYQVNHGKEWKVAHSCTSLPTVEQANKVSVTRSPATATISEGTVTTRLSALGLKNVTAVGIEAKGGHWIGVYEIEVLGQPSRP